MDDGLTRINFSARTVQDLQGVLKAYSEFHDDVKHTLINLPEREMERALWKAISNLERKLLG